MTVGLKHLRHILGSSARMTVALLLLISSERHLCSWPVGCRQRRATPTWRVAGVGDGGGRPAGRRRHAEAGVQHAGGRPGVRTAAHEPRGSCPEVRLWASFAAIPVRPCAGTRSLRRGYSMAGIPQLVSTTVPLSSARSDESLLRQREARWDAHKAQAAIIGKCDLMQTAGAWRRRWCEHQWRVCRRLAPTRRRWEPSSKPLWKRWRTSGCS